MVSYMEQMESKVGDGLRFSITHVVSFRLGFEDLARDLVRLSSFES